MSPNRCRCIRNRATSTRQRVGSKQGPRYVRLPSWTRRISAQRRPRPDFRKSALRRPEGRTPCRQARQRPRKATFLPPCHAQRLIRGAIQQTFIVRNRRRIIQCPGTVDGPNSVGNTISSPVSAVFLDKISRQGKVLLYIVKVRGHRQFPRAQKR